MSETVEVPLGGGRAYSIHIGAGLLGRVGEVAASAARSRRAVVITQPAIARRHLEPLVRSMTDAGFAVPDVLEFPGGERHKHLQTVTRLCDKLYNLAPAVDRKTLVVALGGGVVGDVAGFVSSLYLRGLDYIQVPTTLLAMVDSSVGGKTGVDFRDGKNLVGAFHQPRAVLIDTSTLATLPAREMRAGMAEVIKYGVIAEPDLLPRITREGDAAGWRGTAGDAILAHVVARSCRIKADVVCRDEYETTGLRASLNFGHTLGHALESATRYRRFKHGEAIAIGMMAACYIGEAQGVTPPEIAPVVADALRTQKLPTRVPDDIAPGDLLGLLGRDKKAEAGQARWILATALGRVELRSDVSASKVRDGLMRAYQAAPQGTAEDAQ